MTRGGTIKAIDKVLGTLGVVLLGLKKKSPLPKSFSSILCIQLWGMGESILTLPAIIAVKKANPKATISVLATARNKDVFFGQKDIDNVIELGMSPGMILSFMRNNKDMFDLVIDFEEYLNISAIIAARVGKHTIGFSGQPRSRVYDESIPYNDAQHVVVTCMDLARLAGAKGVPTELPTLGADLSDKKRVDIFLRESGVGKQPFVGFGTSVAESSKSRMWPKENFARLADWMIGKENVHVVFVGTRGEVDAIQEIIELMHHKDKAVNGAGRLSMRQLFDFVGRCRMFIGNDSGPMHVAAAMRVPTIGLFGCNLPERFGPYGKNAMGIRKVKERKPCINVHQGEVRECQFEQTCVSFIWVEDVQEVCERFFRRERK